MITLLYHLPKNAVKEIDVIRYVIIDITNEAFDPIEGIGNITECLFDDEFNPAQGISYTIKLEGQLSGFEIRSILENRI